MITIETVFLKYVRRFNSPVLSLYHCVVIFFGYSEIMDCVLFTFENKRSAHALGGVGGVASFITTDEMLQLNRGCCFPMQAFLPEVFSFQQFMFIFLIK